MCFFILACFLSRPLLLLPLLPELILLGFLLLLKGRELNGLLLSKISWNIFTVGSSVIAKIIFSKVLRNFPSMRNCLHIKAISVVSLPKTPQPQAPRTRVSWLFSAATANTLSILDSITSYTSEGSWTRSKACVALTAGDDTKLKNLGWWSSSCVSSLKTGTSGL